MTNYNVEHTFGHDRFLIAKSCKNLCYLMSYLFMGCKRIAYDDNLYQANASTATAHQHFQM
jgi:hypothetical protein